MECEELLALLSAYMDNEIAQKLVGQVERHLKECGNCTAVFNTFKQVIELYQKSEVEVPPSTHQKLYKTLDLKEFI